MHQSNKEVLVLILTKFPFVNFQVFLKELNQYKLSEAEEIISTGCGDEGSPQKTIING